MMTEARQLADRLIMIVNNDEQQVLKKGRVIIPFAERLEIVQALRVVAEAVAAIDHDSTVKQTLALLRRRFPDAALIFANGGDRSGAHSIAESEVCAQLGIATVFGVGGADKADSSSRIVDAVEASRATRP